ncbi:MAG: hypothetical protein WDO73_13340, partial [Ignavibacteriota bacterium]
MRYWELKMRLLITIALCVAAGTAQEAGRSRTLLTNRDIETLASAGFSEEFITQLIGASRVEFDTSAGAIADLKVHGINEDVIRTMLGARAPASGAAKPEFSRTQPIRVYVQASPDPRKSESHSQTAEIVHTFAVNCPSLTVTSRKETAAFLIVLERASGRLLKPATNRMVVFDRGGDTVYGSQLALPKAVRGFCPLAENLASTQADEGLPGSRLPVR